jgi:hypothetical protein
MQLTELPIDLIYRILEFIPINNLTSCAQVSKLFYAAANAPRFWTGVNLSSFAEILDDELLAMLANSNFAAVNPLAKLQRLQFLSLRDCRLLTKFDVKLYPKLAGLRFLDLANVLVVDEQIAHLIDHCPMLTRINLTRTKAATHTLQAISRHARLCDVCHDQCEEIDNEQ